jgi:putative membrane protein
MMHDWWTSWGAWYGMSFGPWIMLLIFLLVAGVCIAVCAIGICGRRPDIRSPAARAILDERLAKGEIDKNEYEERRRALST